jgi:5-methylthioadenosine/S-adenosylhomocysteine deaminase
MPDPPIDPLDGPRYALEGRVVTMDDDRSDLARARIYVNGGVITAVQPPDTPRPPGFEGMPIVRVGGTIYPGLIELHNHLSYDILPMWDVPQTFTNRDQWSGRDDYRLAVTGPMSVLGRTAGYIEAIVRYVETKCLLGGTTTSQGITLSSNAGILKRYRGIVRNVEETGDADLPDAKTHLADVATDGAEAFLEQLEKASTLLLHLSEGVDASAHQHFDALRIKPRHWAITPALAGIHCAGLKTPDFQRLAKSGGTMVWSPFSNLLLYKKTADITAARRAGVLVALGSDWSPSGSKSLLGELKVASIWNETLPVDVQFSPLELVETVTTNPARILKWGHAIGSIEAGKRADFLVLDGTNGDPYTRLIGARDTALALVVINGVPRYGTAALMTRFNADNERVSVGGSSRALFLTQATADPIVGALTFGEARDRLVDGLHRLPELAAAMEHGNLPHGLPRLGTGGRRNEQWVLDLDQNRESRTGGPLGAKKLPPLSEVLKPMELDTVAMADDDQFLTRMKTQNNLSDTFKQELAAFYD